MIRFHSRLAPWLLFAVAVVAFGLSMVVGPEYSGFTAGLLTVSTWGLCWVAFDAFFLRETSTYEQVIVEKNLAYAVIMAGVAIALAVAFTGGA